MKTSVLSLFLAITIQSPAQDRDSAVKKPEPLNEHWTFQVEKRMTLPACIELQWDKKAKAKLPIAVKIKNPFLEPLTVQAKINPPPCAQFAIEYYDSYLKEWRRPVPMAGSVNRKVIDIKSGEHEILPVEDIFWDFIYTGMPKLELQDPIRIRLVFDLGDISLQSPEFKWNRANKTVVDNRLPAPKSK